MRPFGIRMQTLLPGPTETPMLYGTNAISRHGALTPDMVARARACTSSPCPAI